MKNRSKKKARNHYRKVTIMDNRTDKMGRRLDMDELEQVTGGQITGNCIQSELDHQERILIRGYECYTGSDDNYTMTPGMIQVSFEE